MRTISIIDLFPQDEEKNNIRKKEYLNIFDKPKEE